MEKESKPQISEHTRKTLKDLELTCAKGIEFMRELIDEDIENLRAYKEDKGDIKYRPPLNGVRDGGDPTQIDLTLKLDSMGLALKRAVDTLTAISKNLLSLEGADEPYSPNEEKEHSEDIASKAKRFLEAATDKKK